MKELRTAEQSKRQIPNRDFHRSEAVQFFEWSRFNLHKLVESLPQAAKEEFRAGEMPQSLLTSVEGRWLDMLKAALPPEDHKAAIRKALLSPGE